MPHITRRSAVTALAAGAVLSPALLAAGQTENYEAPDTIYAALAAGPAMILPVREGRIRLVFADSAPGLERDRVLAWVRGAATAVTAYFGRFPVADFGLLIVAEEGDKVGHATTFGYAGSITRIHVGRGADAAAFARDWILTHEMVHLALPDLPRRHLWLQEGNATYVEPIARAQAKEIMPEEVWRWALRGLPQGQAPASAGGLDGTRDHDRLYWGGALFWLLAEIGIAARSHGRRSLRDALRAINRASGGNSVKWTPERIMMVADAATGTTVLADLYARMKDAPDTTDLPDLLRKLGIAAGDNGVVFDEKAPLARLRQSITCQ